MKSIEFGRRGLDESGVSLLETLVALSLFAITAASMGNFLVHQVRRASENNLYTLAYSIGEEHLESVRALSYADMSAGSAQVQRRGATFDVTTQVQSDVPAPNLKKITVDVAWA